MLPGQVGQRDVFGASSVVNVDGIAVPEGAPASVLATKAHVAAVKNDGPEGQGLSRAQSTWPEAQSLGPRLEQPGHFGVNGKAGRALVRASTTVSNRLTSTAVLTGGGTGSSLPTAGKLVS